MEEEEHPPSLLPPASTSTSIAVEAAKRKRRKSQFSIPEEEEVDLDSKGQEIAPAPGLRLLLSSDSTFKDLHLMAKKGRKLRKDAVAASRRRRSDDCSLFEMVKVDEIGWIEGYLDFQPTPSLDWLIEQSYFCKVAISKEEEEEEGVAPSLLGDESYLQLLPTSLYFHEKLTNNKEVEGIYKRMHFLLDIWKELRDLLWGRLLLSGRNLGWERRAMLWIGKFPSMDLATLFSCKDRDVRRRALEMAIIHTSLLSAEDVGQVLVRTLEIYRDGLLKYLLLIETDGGREAEKKTSLMDWWEGKLQSNTTEFCLDSEVCRDLLCLKLSVRLGLELLIKEKEVGGGPSVLTALVDAFQSAIGPGSYGLIKRWIFNLYGDHDGGLFTFLSSLLQLFTPQSCQTQEKRGNLGLVFEIFLDFLDYIDFDHLCLLDFVMDDTGEEEREGVIGYLSTIFNLITSHSDTFFEFLDEQGLATPPVYKDVLEGEDDLDLDVAFEGDMTDLSESVHSILLDFERLERM